MQYSNETNALLFQMYPNNKLDKSCFSYDTLKRLFSDEYIITSSDFHDNNIHLSDKGKAYVELLAYAHPLTVKERIKKWVRDNLLEVIAIIISIAALLKP